MVRNKLHEFGISALVLGWALIPGTGLAQSACTQPVQPACSTGVMSGDSTSGKLRCESDMSKYIQDLEAYRGCLDAAGTRARQQVELANRFRDCLKEDRENCSYDARR
jgi:hypothetical protein